MEKENKTGRRNRDRWKRENEWGQLRKLQESLSQELTLYEEEMGLGGSIPHRKTGAKGSQHLICIYFSFCNCARLTVQSSTVRNWCVLSLKHVWLRAYVFSYCVLLLSGDGLLIEPCLICTTEQTVKPTDRPILGLVTRGLTWAPTVGPIMPHPNSRPELFTPRASRRKKRPGLKISTSFSFIYPNSINQEQLQINEWNLKKITIKK